MTALGTVAARRPGPSGSQPATASQFSRSKGVIKVAEKIGIYGPEGAGKSTLEATMPAIVIADIERSTSYLDVERVDGVTDWKSLRSWVQSVKFPEYTAIGIESMTRAEEWCAEYVIKTKPSNEGAKATDSLEDYKYQAGTTFLCDEFRRFLGDLEQVCNRGINVVMVAHGRITKTKNVDGSDFTRLEPRLVNDERRGSNLLSWVQFLDHLFAVDFDVISDKGKASGGSTRTIYCNSSARRMAKNRGLKADQIPYILGKTTLPDILAGKAEAIVPKDEVPL
jgi:energy-coupling factor transporter ATP-binding protein EcfA2